MSSHPKSPMSRTKTDRYFTETSKSAPVSREKRKQHMLREGRTFEIGLVLFELWCVVIYAIWLDYDRVDGDAVKSAYVNKLYNYFRDVNIMIFFGFGFLMTFMRRYAFSAIGYTFLISAMVIQWSLILEAFFMTVAEEHIHFATWGVNIFNLLNGLFCAGAVMISYGAFLGKVSPTQMLMVGFLEPIFFWLNAYVLIEKLEVVDVGGGYTIHLFGAVFGLACTYFLTSAKTRSHKDNTSAYSSDTFSMAGTLFLWIMWPSFNAAIAPTPSGELRALTNTFLSLCSSTIATFVVSRLLSSQKFEMVHIQNSTLAGGVVMGVAAHLYITPAGALACGFLIGSLSVVGFKYVTPFLSKKLNIQDVCGVANLHGIPGFFSGVVSIFAALGATSVKEKYYGEYSQYFPKGDNQPGYQTAALGITIGFGLVGGIITGILMKFGYRLNKIAARNFFHDRAFWHLPSDYEYVVDDVEDVSTTELIEK